MTTERLFVPYSPNPHQKQVHKSKARFRVCCYHRRSGKTTLAINEIIKRACKDPGLYYYIAPSYRMAKQIAWEMLKYYLPRLLYEKANETDLSIRLHNGATIALRGIENEDSLRGVGLRGVVMDEYAVMAPDVFNRIIRPTLADSLGWAIFLGTPKSKNHFFDVFQKGQLAEHKDWKSWHLAASASGLIAKEELDAARSELPQPIYDAEYEAKFLEGESEVFRGIKDCIAPTLKSPQVGHKYILGVDIAKVTDFSVVVVLDRMTNEVVYFERFRQLDYPFQKAKIESVARRYNHAMIRLDATGVGDPIFDDFQRLGLSVEGFKYTEISKKQLIENLSLLIQEKKIKYPDIPELISELEIFSFTISERGKIRYEAPAGHHDDCVNALALAVWNISIPLGLRKEGQVVKGYTLTGQPIYRQQIQSTGWGDLPWGL